VKQGLEVGNDTVMTMILELCDVSDQGSCSHGISTIYNIYTIYLLLCFPDDCH
jgi:hypothetical protein